ncbi:MAG: thioredoxin family protein [Planctomycetes bacterium]|nr:thioredoxin family protein [Planctomycetota bacterium]
MNARTNLFFALGLSLLALGAALGCASDAVEVRDGFVQIRALPSLPDVTWVPRELKKAPAFKSEKVRYAIYVLGEGRKSAMILAWDESEGTGKGYDTLYADKNFNGDLTEDGEHFFSKNPADPKKAENGAFERYHLGKIKEADGPGEFEFHLESAYSNDALTYPTEFRVNAAKGGFAVGCIPGNISLKWSNELKAAPVYVLGGPAVPSVNEKQPGESLGTLEAGRSFHAWYTVRMFGDSHDTQLRFAFSTVGSAGQPQTLLRVLDKDGKTLEELPFVGGCACGGGYGQEVLIPSRVPPGKHEVVARIKRPESLGGPADFIYPIEVTNPMYGKPIRDPAYTSLKQSFPGARVVSLRRIGGEKEAQKAFPEEVLVPGKVEDNHLMEDCLPYQNDGGDRTLLVGHRQGDGRSHEYRMLLRFDLSALPKDAKIQAASARLTLVASDQYSQLKAGAVLEAYAMRRTWIESIARSVHETPYSNWYGPAMLYQKDNVVKWGKPGADDPEVDRYPEPACSVEVGEFPALLEPGKDAKGPREPWRMVGLDLTALMKKWQSGEIPNCGVLLKVKGSLSSYVCSSEFPDYPFRPTLVVAYEGSEAKAEITVAPGEDLAAAVNRAKESKRPVLVKFYSSTCGVCRRVEESTYADAEVKKALGERFELVRLKVEDHADLAAELGVGSVPAVVVLAPDGKTQKALLAASQLKDAQTFLDALQKLK